MKGDGLESRGGHTKERIEVCTDGEAVTVCKTVTGLSAVEILCTVEVKN